MIRVSKDSMWYKFYTQGLIPHALWEYEVLPYDLCTFMRRVLVAAFISFWLAAVIIMLALCGFVLFPLTLLVPDLLAGELYEIVRYLSFPTYAITIVVGGQLLIHYATDAYSDYKDRKLGRESMRNPTLLGNYWRAIKDKVCPLITYEGEAS